MSLMLTGKSLIRFLLKNPNTHKFQNIYYKFNHKYKGSLTLDEFYVFVLNYSYKIQKDYQFSKSFNKKHYYFEKKNKEHQNLENMLINCIFNLKINPKERCILPSSAYISLQCNSNIFFGKNTHINCPKKINIIEKINISSCFRTAFLSHSKMLLKPLDIINFFEPNKNNISTFFKLSQHFKFNIEADFYKLFEKYSIMEQKNTSKTILILSSLREKSKSHQKIFETFIFSIMKSSHNFEFSLKELKFLQILVAKNIINLDDFYNKPIFLLDGCDSPLHKTSVLFGKDIIIEKDNYFLKSLHPYMSSIFNLEKVLPIKELTLAHIFLLPFLFIKDNKSEKKYHQLIEFIDFNRFSFGNNFLLESLIEIKEDKIPYYNHLIKEKIDFFKSYITKTTTKPKLKDQNIFTLSNIFYYLVSKNKIEIDAKSLKTLIDNCRPEKRNPGSSNIFKNKKIVSIYTEELENLENILLKKQMEEELKTEKILPSKILKF